MRFKRQTDEKTIFEPLQQTVALAKRMGFTLLYDPSYRTLEAPRLNLTGAVPLDEWSGMISQNGGSYEYALIRSHIHGRPLLPLDHPLRAAPVPSCGRELAVYALEYDKALARVGPFGKFLLGDAPFDDKYCGYSTP